MKRKYKYSAIKEKQYQQKSYSKENYQQFTIDHQDDINLNTQKRKRNDYSNMINKFVNKNIEKNHKNQQQKPDNSKNYQSLNKLQADDEFNVNECADEINQYTYCLRKREKNHSCKETAYDSEVGIVRNKWKNNILRRKNNGNYGQIIKGKTKNKYHSFLSHMDSINFQRKKMFTPIGDLSIVKRQNSIYRTDKIKSQQQEKKIRLVISKNAARRIQPKIKIAEIDKNYYRHRKMSTQPANCQRLSLIYKKVEKFGNVKLKIISTSPQRFINGNLSVPTPWEIDGQF